MADYQNAKGKKSPCQNHIIFINDAKAKQYNDENVKHIRINIILKVTVKPLTLLCQGFISVRMNIKKN